MHGPRKWGTWDVKDVYPQIAAGCLGDGIGEGKAYRVFDCLHYGAAAGWK